MRLWRIGCSLGVFSVLLVLGLVSPTRAETLGGFDFPLVRYSNTLLGSPPLTTHLFEGHGTEGTYLGMGNIIVDLRFMPDPEGRHANLLAHFLPGRVFRSSASRSITIH